MKILYLTNKEVPYRVRFFNELNKHYDLTVMYESRNLGHRDKAWCYSVEKQHKAVYLNENNNGNIINNFIYINMLLNQGWDYIIIGCLNSTVQLLAMTLMRLRGIPYIINLDGEQFIGNDMKSKLKAMILKGAKAYLVAGEKSCETFKKALGNNINALPYYFSSLSNAENCTNALNPCPRENYVLVVGAYLNYKGLDVAYKAACIDTSISYKFVGMGKNTEAFLQDMGTLPPNIEVIPFLQKEDLEAEYRKCAMLLLPSRQECWGLVVNEAASFGTPIVSTWGSGAAVEFLSDDYPQFLAKPGDATSLLKCVRACLNDDSSQYSRFLIDKNKAYSIEKSVEWHINVLK